MDKRYQQTMKDVAEGISTGVGGYLKAQCLLAGMSFIILSIGFFILDIPWFLLVALGIAILDLIPMVGTGLAMVPWILIVLIMGNKDLAIGLSVLYFIQFMCRQVAEPLIMGKKVALRPVVAFLATFLGGIFLGPMGFLLGPILAMTVAILYQAWRKNFYPNDKIDKS